jgi:hypothetical protein
MPSWKGNPANPVPNTVQQPDTLSEKKIADNRAEHVRRDQDDHKDFTIGLYDIDETILTHLENMQLHVLDNGTQVKVPFFFGSPEKWVSARRDGYIRDKQGKIILPAIIFKRTNSETDPQLQFFHRYLNIPVIRKYSQKNRYTQFTTLAGQNAPVHEVFSMVMPSHMVLTYQFIIWTESVAQMNKLVETFQFNTKDYWGSNKGFRFRTKVDGFGHTTELQEGDDRIVKSEFTLTTHGYVLPETMTKLDGQKATTQRQLTKKKVIMGAEVVGTGYDWSHMNDNSEKWRNLQYPNLPKSDVIQPPPIVVSDGITDNSSISSQIVNSLRAATSSPTPPAPLDYGTQDGMPYLRVVDVPPALNSNGNTGNVAFDDTYFYIYTPNGWKRVPIAQFS